MKHTTKYSNNDNLHNDYNSLLDRLDNALIKNESLQDEIKILKHTKLVETSCLNDRIQELKKELEEKELERLGNITTIENDYIFKIQSLSKQWNELIEEQADEIKALKLDKEELVKDVEFYRSKVKVLLDDMLQYNINSNKHNDYYISQIKAIKTIAEKPLNLCDNLNDIIAICCDMGIEFNDINLGNKRSKNA